MNQSKNKTDKEIGKICKGIVEGMRRFPDVEKWEITKRLFESLIITCKIQGIDINNLEVERAKIYGNYSLEGKRIKITDMEG